ncbi:LamG-like jellyroll fold domain-containing protein [Winogradskyella pulchriflava]|uniref:LamG-like jellyroll fold domain-containing protein n=1 Tax=Winogradskyella pulchriflava TaxID=1110688 RepID=A0ABV6Q885_9FLAO
MKNKGFKSIFIIFVLLLFRIANGQSGIYESYLIINSDLDPLPNEYYDLQAETGNPDFNGANLGTFTQSNSLVLNGAEQNVYQCGNDNILNGWLNYRIYEQSATAPAYTSSSILFGFNNGNANHGVCTPALQQRWESTAAGIDVLNGLPSGEYYLEVYTHADVDDDSDNILDFTHYANAGGTDYRASFRVDNPPIANCQNITVQLDASGNATIVPADINNGSTDDFDTPSLSIDINTFDCTDIGTPITVTLTVEDSLGQTDTCTALVTVEDNVAPTAICQDITVQLDALGNASIVAADIDGGSTDNCSSVTLSASPTSFTCADIGANNVTLTVDDGNGQTSSCVAIVTVEDNVAPTASCQNITVQLDATGNASIAAADIDNGSTDNCGSVSLSASQTSFTCADIGANNVTLTVDDGNGQTSSCVAIVTVEDNVAPTASCQDITVQLDASGNVSIFAADIDNGSTDNCGSVTLSASQTSFTCADIGANNVTLTVDDGNGQTSSCVAVVTVEDNVNPTAVCQDITVQLDALGNASIVAADIDGGSTDNCSSVSLSASQTSFTCADIGAKNVTLTVDDGNGQTSSCVAVVTVEDNVVPTAICQDITVQLDASGNASIVAADIDNGSTDNCGFVSLSASQTSFTCADIGANNVTLTVDDGNGQTSSCVAVVTVEDNVAPTAICQDITVQLDASGNVSIFAADIDGGSTDNCGSVSLSASQTNFTCADIGTNNVTLTVDDGNGQTSSCVAVVIVEDNIAPTVSCQSITIQLDAFGNTSIVAADIDNGSSDNCGSVTLSASQTNFTCADIGANNVTLTVDDGNGQTSTCVAVVTVEDNVSPTAICQDITVQLDAFGNASIVAADIDNGSYDNCGISSITLDETTFNCSDLGVNTVTLFVRDTSNNLTTCTANVTVTDPAASATVSIVSDDSDNLICDGDNLTFTATPTDGGASPIYEWFIDNISYGTNSPTFTPITPLSVGTHDIYVRMQSSLSACINPKQSNTITVTVQSLPNVTSPTQICIGDTGNLLPNSGGTWISNNTSIATVDNTGLVTSVATGSVTFTYTDSTTGCSSTTNNVTINALPVISNLPTDNELCVNETHTLSPTTGGTWSSSDTGIATITNSGVITGISDGYVNFTFTNATTGCSRTSPFIEVLEIPEITNITASPDTLCAGDDSILTATIAGAGVGSTDIVLVNYNFNSGSDYSSLNGQEAIGITSSLTSSNIPFDRSQSGRTANNPPAFAPNLLGQALRQIDDWQDGYVDPNNDPGGMPDDGDWTFTLGGGSLSNYQNFEVYFDAKRQDAAGLDKTIVVEFSTDNGATWSSAGTRSLRAGTTSYKRFTQPLPGVTNPNNLQIRLSIDDGSTYLSGIGIYSNETNPHVLLDNFQVKASVAGPGYTYNWSVVSGDTGSLPAFTNSPQITVTPNVTTEYEVTVTSLEGCPATDTVTVNVNPTPEISFSTNYCPNVPHNNEVEITAISSIPGTTFQWVITYPNIGDPDYTHGGHDNTSDTAYVDTAGTYQVIATSPSGCTSSATINIATELVVNGNFSQGNIGFTSDYTYHPDIAGNTELVNDSGTNGYSISTNGNDVNPSFWGNDHTGDAASNFMVVNGHGNTLVVWRQQVTIEPNTEYYFSVWGMSLNDNSQTAQLTFNIDGTNVGTPVSLPTHPNDNNPGSDNWTRIYGTWTSPNLPGPQNVNIEIRNLNSSSVGVDFGLDDISFSTLDPFIILTSPDYTDDEQIICQDTAFEDITYAVGGASNGADIQWWLDGTPVGTGPYPNNTLPTGIQTNFNGEIYRISGTPTQFGTYTYTISTSSACGTPKTASGTIVVNEAPTVSITQPASLTVCEADGTINLEATLGGSAIDGTWSIGGTPITTTTVGNIATATYTIATTGPVTFTFTSNDPSGPCDPTVETLSMDISTYITANAGIDITRSNCSKTTTSLAANNVAGQWSVISGQPANSYYFADATMYNTDFTGESGEIYILQWEATNSGACANDVDTMTLEIPDCRDRLIFDGFDDSISFGDNYGLDSGAFSIEAWVKPDIITGTQTIISKRNSNNLNSGYDLSLVNNRLYFRWNNQSMFSTQTMNNTKWYHVAVTFNGTNTYKLYIDGFAMQTNSSGSSPNSNTNKALIGAMDTTNDLAINYFDGVIDEVRFWNTELSIDQIRAMMNQEIEANGANVRGVVVPIDITGGLQWNSLIGYYQMLTGSQTTVADGNLYDISTVSPVIGKLSKMTAEQIETAPIPYITNTNGAWDTATTWLNGSLQQLPNSTVNSINGTAQTWNIVISQHNVSSNRPTRVAGLLVDSNKLSITNDQLLTVDTYLKIDGTLDLVDQSQLLQPMGSIVDYSGGGNLERDQQGTSNLFNYNYWSAPVSTDGASFTVAGVLYDGTTASNPQPVNWTSSYNANALTNPITISRRWLFLYENYPENSFADWNEIDENQNIPVGLGYSMKGSGSGTADQNYTFIGQPNNGTITSPVTGGYQALVGNPYPSAIDANAFINDNNTVLSDGSLYFWEHAASNNSHNLSAYEGGYAVRNILTGLPAVSPPQVNGTGNANKIPGRYVPVAQGFFVTGNATGGNIVFRNSQRAFVKEQGSNSVFLRPNAASTDETISEEGNETVQLIRLDFISPENAVRHLAIGFTNDDNATEGIDYGYDALNQDAFPNDMSFNIEGEKFVIQGVNTFDDTKTYPLDIDLATAGPIEIALRTLENFEDTIDVMIFDALNGSYTRINDYNFQINLEAGNYSNRFYLVFQEDSALSTVKETLDQVIVHYLQNTNEIYVSLPQSIQIEQMTLINILGQTVVTWNSNDLPTTNTFKIPVEKVSEGSYILKVKTDKGFINKKLIVKY